MTGGKAFGVNRDYQVECRNLLMRRDTALKPYGTEGIDVRFRAGGTTWTFDVVLTSPNDCLVVAECRRWATPVKQEAVAGFAKKVDLVRDARRVPVAGVFFVKTAYQVGALRLGDYLGIQLAAVSEEDGFSHLYFYRWDHTKNRRIRDAVIFLPFLGPTSRVFPPTVTVKRRRARGRLTRG